MLIYIIIFGLVIIIFSVSEHFRVKCNQPKISYLFALLAIGLLSLFASLRADTIGTDVLVYAKPYLEYINLYGLNWLIKRSDCEILYLLLTSLVSSLGGNLQVLLFIITFIISFLVYKYAIDNSDRTNVVLVFSTYLFVFFGFTLNLIRQSIAIAIILYAMKFVKERKLFPFLLCIIIASGFHTTSIAMVLLYFIYGFFGKRSEAIVKCTTIPVLLFVVIFYRFIIKYLYILSDKYTLDYISSFIYEGININFTWEILKIFTMIIVFALTKNSRSMQNDVDVTNKNYFSFCKFLLVVDFILFQLGAIMKFAERFSLYFMIISLMYLIPSMSNSTVISKNKSKGKIISYILIYLTLFANFYIMFNVLKISSIIPFEFRH